MSRKKLLQQCLNISKAYLTNNKKLEPNKHFSFLIQNNAILAIGVNRRGNVPKKFKYNEYSNIHSEVDVMSKGKAFVDNRKPWYIINIRLNNFKECMLSSPCSCCTLFLKVLGCSKVVYSNFNNKFEKICL